MLSFNQYRIRTVSSLCLMRACLPLSQIPTVDLNYVILQFSLWKSCFSLVIIVADCFNFGILGGRWIAGWRCRLLRNWATGLWLILVSSIEIEAVESEVKFYSFRMEAEAKDSITARKVQKADREKLRRDRLNEQFMELGNALDPDRPKNDKASILTDTIQMLKDLTAQVERLKSEYGVLTEESRELTLEKNDLREEKSSLKSEIENLNAQYQQRLRAMYPWGGIDHSAVMHPYSYPFPLPVPVPAGPIPLHPSLQPYPFSGNQNRAVVPNPCSTYVPYMTHNAMIDQQSTHHVSQIMQQSTRSHPTSKQDPRNKTSDGESRVEKSDNSNDITTDLELKTPGSTAEQDSSSKQRKAKKVVRNETSLTYGSSSTGCSSSRSVQAISSNSVISG